MTKVHFFYTVGVYTYVDLLDYQDWIDNPDL